MKAIDKGAIVQKLRELLANEIATATQAARDAREAATHEEARPENDKDTRGLEASYLARGQAERVRELERGELALRSFTPGPFADEARVQTGALVELEDELGPLYCFVAPAAGGERVNAGGVEVQVVTPQSPLGRALLGKAAGDDVEIALRGRSRELTIVAVR